MFDAQVAYGFDLFFIYDYTLHNCNQQLTVFLSAENNGKSSIDDSTT